MNVKMVEKVLVAFALVVSAVSAESVESLMASGQNLLERGAYSQAVTAFRQVVAREPDNFESQFNLAFAYLQWGRTNNAIEEYKKCLQWQPKNSQVWSNLAIAYGNIDKKEEALYSLSQAVTYDPSNVTARMNLAAMYANAGKSKAAMEQYQKVLEIDPTHEEALVNMSKCLISEKQYDDGIKYLNKTAEAYPNNGEVHHEMANIHWKIQKNIDKALSEYKLALTLNPENISFYDNYVAALLEKGNKAEAIELLKKSVIYTDDPIRKDRIRTQINRLETGNSSGQSSSGIASEKIEAKDQISDLRKELHKDKSGEETKRIDAKPVNVMGDLEGLNDDSNAPAALDLRSEAKKRAAEK